RHKSRASCKPLAASRPRPGPPRPPAFPGQSPEWPPFGDTKQRRARASIAFVIGNGDAGSKQCLAWIASPRRLSKGTLLVKKLLRTHLGNAQEWTHDAFHFYTFGLFGRPRPKVDNVGGEELNDNMPRMLRGGSFFEQPLHVRSS